MDFVAAGATNDGEVTSIDHAKVSGAVNPSDHQQVTVDTSASNDQQEGNEGNSASNDIEQQQDPKVALANTLLLDAAQNGDLQRVQSLLDGTCSDAPHVQAEAYFQDEETGTSVMMVAALHGHGDVVEELLARGAPWNALDRCGRCAGEYAIDGNHQAVVDQLVNAGVRAEMLLGAVESARMERAVPNEEYLTQEISCDKEKIVDENQDAVMMSWEAPLMEQHAKVLAQGGNQSILNVGFGMGIVDSYIQEMGPVKHTIIEAHPDVYQRMKDQGWLEKPNVTVHFGRWQDVVGTALANETFDGIFFDTYGEYYRDLQEFQAHLPRLLRHKGIYSFFNGLCPRNIFFHGVYCQIAQLELESLGMEVVFIPMEIDTSSDQVWEGVSRRYWWNDTYYLPLALMKKEEQQAEAAVAEQ